MGCDSSEETVQASLLQHLVKEDAIIKAISNPENDRLRKAIQKHLLKDLLDIISPAQILSICDTAGISDKGYAAMYQCVTRGLRAKGVTRSLLPTPYSISMARKLANANVGSLFGGYKWVEGAMPISPAKSYEYNRFNNIYINVEALQKAMILFYDLSLQETGGKAIFVLKLDECQVVKGQRLERTSLTLMSRALRQQGLHHTPDEHDMENVAQGTSRRKQDYFGVQSEKNIWWQAAWTLPHEDQETLRWYFNRTGIQEVVQRQTSGELLHVPGIGAFQVEWHLGGDLKTLKCMLGTKMGANTMFPCIYCCHPKMPNEALGRGKKGMMAKGRKSQVGKSSGNTQKGKATHVWFNGIMSCDQSMPPRRDQEDNTWNPILSIPLSQVHVCTLHARLRILDKLLRLHVNYAWNMEPETRRDECIRGLEAALSSIGLHDGAVTLSKDRKNPNTTQDNPNKICMGGAKARRLLSNHTDALSHTNFEVWKKVCDATTYRGNEASLGIKRARVWESCDAMIDLLERPTLTESDIELFKASVHQFTDLMVDAWGETHITHYMVRVRM